MRRKFKVSSKFSSSFFRSLIIEPSLIYFLFKDHLKNNNTHTRK